MAAQLQHLRKAATILGSDILTRKPLADKAHISTFKTYSQQRDYRFDMKIFTKLRNARSITLAYEGLDPLPPMFCF